MKKFTINCDFGGQMSPFAIYIGKPEKGHHPLYFQADWLSKARGGMIPGEVMEAVTQLQELAEKNGVSLEELCVYALGTKEQQAELESEVGSSQPEQKQDQAEQKTAIDEKLVQEGSNYEKHEVESHTPNTMEEDAEDMASEGGHIAEDIPDEGKISSASEEDDGRASAEEGNVEKDTKGS